MLEYLSWFGTNPKVGISYKDMMMITNKIKYFCKTLELI